MTNIFRETEERLRRLVEGAQDIIYDCDAMGNFTYVNPASAKLMLYQETELLGRHFITLIHPDFREQAGAFYTSQLLERRLNTYFEFPAMAKDGHTLWIGQHVQLVYDGPRIVGFQAIARDITRQKNLEEQLRHAQKLDAVGQLAAGIAHNFNNLLTTMLGYAELTLGNQTLDAGVRHDVEEIWNAGQRASNLTRQLLAFARKQSRSLEDVDLNQAAANTVAMLSGLLQENIAVICDAEPRGARIWIDPAELEQLLINIALNARDAMLDGGRLTIEVRRVHEAPSVGQPVGDYLRLRVIDTGTGMPPEIRERVFEPFFTTKEQGQGTGLGLSFVHGIVKDSKGFINVESLEGKGSTFTIHFPPAASTAKERAVTSPAPVTDRTILLVEDEDGVRNIASRLLNRKGFRVLAASRPSEARALFDKHGPEIDLLLTDVIMPEMTGPSLATQLLVERPGLPVLFMSGYSHIDGAQLASQPNTAFLAKPFTASALTGAVDEILQRPASLS